MWEESTVWNRNRFTPFSFNPNAQWSPILRKPAFKKHCLESWEWRFNMFTWMHLTYGLSWKQNIKEKNWFISVSVNNACSRKFLLFSNSPPAAASSFGWSEDGYIFMKILKLFYISQYILRSKKLLCWKCHSLQVVFASFLVTSIFVL